MLEADEFWIKCVICKRYAQTRNWISAGYWMQEHESVTGTHNAFAVTHSRWASVVRKPRPARDGKGAER